MENIHYTILIRGEGYAIKYSKYTRFRAPACKVVVIGVETWHLTNWAPEAFEDFFLDLGWSKKAVYTLISTPEVAVFPPGKLICLCIISGNVVSPTVCL